MVTRVATSASHNMLMARLIDVQSRVHDAQLQVSTEKRSQNYTGIALNAERLVNFENQRDMAQRYVDSNTTAQLRLNTMSTSVTAAEATIRNFRSAMQGFSQLDLSVVNAEEQIAIEDIGLQAFNAMKDLESYLNTRIEGRYLFAGGMTDTRPVTIGHDSLGSFQGEYDGANVIFPTTAARHTASFSMVTAEYGNLTFDAAGKTITSDASGTDTTPFSEMPVGSTFTISGSTSNDGTYTITANTGSVVTVSEALVNEGPAGTSTITAVAPNTYYNGDQLELSHRLDEDRTITLGINASNGAFEKAIRAMAMIAQDGLENNTTRVTDAISLLNDALQHDASANPNENTQDVATLQSQLGRNLVLLDDSNSRHKDYMNFLDTRIIGIENVDMIEAATRLNDETNALDISMKALARVTQLSLANYV